MLKKSKNSDHGCEESAAPAGWVCRGARSASAGAVAGVSGRAGRTVSSYRDRDRKSTRLNSSHITRSRMPSSA